MRTAPLSRLFVSGLTCASLFLIALGVRPVAAAIDAAGVRRVLTLLDVVAEEYREGVANGEIVRPVEYDEAKLFLDDAQDRLGRALGAESSPLTRELDALRAALDRKAPAADIRAAVDRLQQQLTAETGVSNDVYPPQPPSAARGRALFENCVSCHGPAGDGKGESAAELHPPPANFTDHAFMRAETPYDFFQIITVGKAGTAMPAWGDALSPQERWDLVSYLWGLRAGSGGLAEGQGVYLSQCAGCHGARGDGKGLYSGGLLTPAPDLSTTQSLARHSDADLFAATSDGKPGTAMPSFGRHLNEDERWQAVGYLRTLALAPADGLGGAGAGEGGPRRLAGILRLLADEYRKAVPAAGDVDELEYRESAILLDLVAQTAGPTTARLQEKDPQAAAELRARVEQIAALVKVRGSSEAVGSLASAAAESIQQNLGAGPEAPVAAPDALSETRRLLDDALAAYGRNDPRARDLVSDAYFQFEPLEKKLGVVAPDLTRKVESAFLDLRGVVARPQAMREAAAVVATINGDLDQARTALEPRTEPYGLMAQSAMIILREGFEVVLIVGALLAFVSKSGQTEMRRPIQLGAATGVAMSMITAYLFTLLFRGTSGAAAETLEGVTLLIASGVLFFVSYWLISKAEAEKWQRYIQGKVRTALSAGSGLALAGAAFLAVYREGVETVLFYQALLGSAAGAFGPVLTGFVAGSVALAIVYALFVRFGKRLPIRPFFLGTSVLLYYLAIVFAGKGVAELQEGGWVTVTPLAWVPRFEFFGLFPTVETMLAQGLFLALLLYAVVVLWRRRPSAPPADAMLVELRALRELATDIRATLLQRPSTEPAPSAVDRQMERLIEQVTELEGQMRLNLPGNGGAKAASA